MRKKKEQVESPVIPLLTIPLLEPIPTVPARGSDAIASPVEEVMETAEKQVAAPLESPPGPPATKSPDVDMDTSSSPAPEPEPEPIEANPEAAQPPQVKPDGLAESWPPFQLFEPGFVVDLRPDSARDRIRGIIESVVSAPERPLSVWFRSMSGKIHVVVPVTDTAPVRPTEEGEVVVVLSGLHKRMVGKIVRFAKDIVSVDLDNPITVVADIELHRLCMFSREGPPSPAPQSEDGEILQDPPPRSQSQQPNSLPSPPAATPLRAAPINAPTQPRSFQNAWKNNTSPTIPSRPNSLSHLLNANPNGGVNNNLSNLSNTFANSPIRPSPPSGPKALRGLNPRSPFDGSRFKPGGLGSGLNGGGMGVLPGVNGNGMGAGLKRELNPNNGHPAIPKGPSADRERERDRSNGNWTTKNWGGGWR